MKKTFLLCITLFALHCHAQTNKIGDVNTFKVRNAGAIMDKNNDVDGYYFYYVLDKLKKGNVEFAIQILDKNLVEVAKKSYIDNKNTFLMNSKFNNQSMMFAMGNWKEDEITLLTYDKQANLTQTLKIPLESKEVRYYAMMQKMEQLNTLFPVDNKGFLFNKLEDNKKIGYSLKYYPTDGGKAWEFNSPEKSKEILAINPIEVNDKVVVALETARPGLMSNKLTFRTKVIDINTGQLLYEREYSKKGKPRIINNAFLDKDSNVVLMGEYFEEGDNIMKDKSLGMFTEVIDMTGKTTKESFISWKEDVSKIVKTKNGFLEDKGYVYFHNIARTESNDYYAIGEFYKKTISGAGVASALLGGDTPLTQLTITNSVIFKFNADFKLVNIQEFEKGKSRVECANDYGSPQMNAHYIDAFGGFDYEYTQLDKANDRFFACFIDYERLKGESNKNAFKTIIYDDGKLTEDKIYLKDGKKNFRVMPAKVGNVLLMEYDKKAKTIDLHMEKLNIK